MKNSLKKIVLCFQSFTLAKVKKNAKMVTGVPVEPTVEALIPEVQVDKVKEEKNDIIDPGNFVADDNDANLFFSLKDRSLSIRVIKSHPGGKEKNKDQFIFSTSLPHKFNPFTLKAMKNFIPQLTGVDFSKSHELLITKSAASRFDDLQNAILKFIFLRLNKEYSWLYEEQIVLIESCPNPDVISFNLRVPTSNHLELGIAIFEINGICTQLAGEPFPLCMDHENNYDFNLEKGKAFNWEELLPEIKEAFLAHFPAGVKFTGYMHE